MGILAGGKHWRRIGGCPKVINYYLLATQIKIHLLDVLLDGVHFFLSCDFHLGIGPSGHFHDHVVDLVLGISVRRNVVEGTI